MATARAGKQAGKTWRGLGWTPDRRERFLAVLAEVGNVRLAAQAVGYVHAANAYKLRYSDPDFAAAWDRAVAEAVARIEGALVARALAEIEARNAALENDDRAELGEPFSFEQIMKLLTYYRTAQGKPVRGGPKRRYATREETDAALMKKLDMLEARVKARNKREAEARKAARLAIRQARGGQEAAAPGDK